MHDKASINTTVCQVMHEMGKIKPLTACCFNFMEPSFVSQTLVRQQNVSQYCELDFRPLNFLFVELLLRELGLARRQEGLSTQGVVML